MRRWRGGSPVTVMMTAALGGLLVALLATVLAARQPWLGLALLPDDDGGVHIVAVADDGPAAGLLAAGPAAPLTLTGLAPAEGNRATAVVPTAADLTPEPDVLPTYEAMAAFLARQNALAVLLRGGPVAVTVQAPDGTERQITVVPHEARPLASLPPVYWFQLAVGMAGLLLSFWVLAVRRQDRASLLFALVGLSMLTFTTAAALYSSRELALPAPLFRLLAEANTAGALTFGIAMIGVFLSYPRRLVPAWVLLLPVLVFGGWYVASALRLPAGPATGPHLATLAEMICIVAAIAAQWWSTRRDPTGRAALSWLGLSVILGAGAFVTLISVPPLLGHDAAIAQGYAFGFFLLIHTGLALGLRRYRLFEMGEWAFRVMLVTLGLLALLALDAVLIVALHLDEGLALGLALLAVGFLYLPLRDRLWRRLVGRRTLTDHALFAAVMEVAFVASPERRADAWHDLLRRLFDPLEMTPLPSAEAVAVPAIAAEGLVMRLPASADAPPLALRYPWGGRGLFGPSHLAMAARLCELMARAAAGRDAFARGAQAERLRIAADLHDDVGARLLAALHQGDLSESRRVVRAALADIRAIVGGLSGARQPLDGLLADLRHETADRLEAAGLALHWPLSEMPDTLPPVDYPLSRALTAVVREAVSNCIRHAGASRLTVTTATDAAGLTVTLSDDGRGLGSAEPRAATASGGHGLPGMARRAGDLGGRFTIAAAPEGGTCLTLWLPWSPPTQTAALTEAAAA